MNSKKPEFHFSCPKGWMNDPNGFSFFNGKYHLFFQSNPDEKKWGLINWGHATTKNLLFWKNNKPALKPEDSYDSMGCFSGTALSLDEHYLMYTGVHEKDGEKIQEQCLAIGDGKTYRKYSENPVIKTEDVGVEFIKTEFRDPKIWKSSDKEFYCACVVQLKDKSGAVVLFKSENLIEWKYAGKLIQLKDRMIECPDIFCLGEKDVMIFSTVLNDDKSPAEKRNAVFLTGKFDSKKESFIFDDENAVCPLDYGIDFYAPQTLETPDGRRVMIAWMQNWESIITNPKDNWVGQMTLPREISFKDGKLIQKPVKEFEELVNKKPYLSGVISKNMPGSFNKYNYIHSEFDINAVVSGPNESFKLNLEDSENRYVEFNFNSSTMELSFDRSASIDAGTISKKSVKIECEKNNQISLRFIIDTNSCEVFINGGTKVFTASFCLDNKKRSINLETKMTKGLGFKIIKL